jgi:hypothetical protein
MKQERTEEIKRELFTEGEVLVLMCSPKVFRNTLRLTPSVPLHEENTLV